MFGFFPIGLCRRQPRNRQIHRQEYWKRHRISGVVGKERNISFVGFLGNVEQKWCRKYRKWLCCEIFVTKSKLKASLAVWRNLLRYIFQGGLQPGSPSGRAAPGWEVGRELTANLTFPAVTWKTLSDHFECPWDTRNTFQGKLPAFIVWSFWGCLSLR